MLSKRTLFTLLAVVLPVIGVLMYRQSSEASTVYPPDENGIWVPNSHTFSMQSSIECGPGTICADWQGDTRGMEWGCCIPEDKLYSGEPLVCLDWRETHSDAKAGPL